jgi:hypothetical protein
MKTPPPGSAKNTIPANKRISRGIASNMFWRKHSLFAKAFENYAEKLPRDSFPRGECLLSRFIDMCDKRLDERIRAESKRNRSPGFADGLNVKHGGIAEDRYDAIFEEKYSLAYAEGYERRGMIIDQILKEFIPDSQES